MCEFPKFEPINLWFDYPAHRLDDVGVLGDIKPESDKPAWEKAIEKRKTNAKKEQEDKRERFINAVKNCNFGEPPTLADLSNSLDLSERQTRVWVKNYGYFIDKNDGTVKKKTTEK